MYLVLLCCLLACEGVEGRISRLIKDVALSDVRKPLIAEMRGTLANESSGVFILLWESVKVLI